MAYEFHYTPTGTGAISGTEVLEQTEDAINDLGNTAISGVQAALDKAEQAFTNSANAVDDAQTALNTANNAEGVAIQAQTDVGNLSGTVANIGNRVTTAEGNISNLQGRMTTAEGNITNLQGRMTTAEGSIGNLQTAVSTAQATANSAQQTATTARQQSYVFRYSSTVLVASSTNSNTLLDNTDNLKVGDKVIDSSGVLFSITAIDTQNSTFTIGTALIDLAQDSDAVRYNTVQSLSASQQLQARTNIGALGSDEFNSQGGVKFKTNNDYLQLLSTNDNILSRLPWRTIPNVYSYNEPVRTDILWSGDLDDGDITISYPFTNYDVLMCVYGAEDNPPGTPPWNFSVIPVWMMKKAIIDKNFFGVVPTTFDILNDYERRWEIVVADSTATFFKYHFDADVHMWRIIGIRYTEGVPLV